MSDEKLPDAYEGIDAVAKWNACTCANMIRWSSDEYSVAVALYHSLRRTLEYNGASKRSLEYGDNVVAEAIRYDRVRGGALVDAVVAIIENITIKK